MARVVKTKKINKKRIKQTKKRLIEELKASGLSGKEARKQAGATAEDVYEAGRQKTLAENAAKRAENQAKREAYFKRGEESQAKLKQSKAESAQKLKDQELANRVTVGGKTYRDQASADFAMQQEESKKSDERTARGKANISAARQAKPGEAYTRINPDGTTKKVVKIDPSKKNQGKVTEKPVAKTVKTSNQGKVTKEPVAKTVKTSDKDKLSKTSTPSKTPTKTKSELAAKPSAKTKPSSYSTSGAVKSGSAGSGSVDRGPSIMDRIKTKLQEGDEAVRNLPGTIGKGVDRARKYFGFEHGGRINKLKKKAKHGGALAIMIAPVKTKKMKAVKKAPGGASMKKMPMYKDGGKLKMVKGPDGKMVPFYAADGKGKMKNGGKVTGPDKKKKSVVTVDQDLKDLGNALKEGVKMVTIPGYGMMKLSQYLSKRKKGMSKTEIVKAMKSAGKAGGEEAAQEMAMKKTKIFSQKGKLTKAVKKPTMKKTMTKLVKTKDTRPYSKRPRPDYTPQTVRDKKKNEARPKMEYGGKVTDPKKGKMMRKKPKTDPNINPATGLYYRKPGGADENKSRGAKMMYGGSMKKAMYGAKMKKMEDGGKVSKYGRKHDRIRAKGFKIRTKGEDKFLSTIGNNNMSQKKKERIRRKADKLETRSMLKFDKAKAIRNKSK